MKKVIEKVIIGGIALLYFLWPVDLVPDIVPVIGFIDDIAVLFGALYLIFKR